MYSPYYNHSATLPIDKSTGAVPQITTEHAMIHAGKSFELTGTFAANTTKTAVIQFAPPTEVAATVTIDMTNANADITYTAATKGTAGNGITVTHIDPDAASAELSVSVLNKAIIVNLATDGSKAITSTGAEVVAAIAASAEASALVTATDEGDGAGVVNAKAVTSLAGGTDKLYIHFKSLEVGAGADIVTVSIWEGASFTGTAATFTPINNKRISPPASLAVVTGTLDASITTTSATKIRQITVRGSATGANVRQSSGSAQEELMFDPGKVYIVAFVPTGATAIDYAIKWYEMSGASN